MSKSDSNSIKYLTQYKDIYGHKHISLNVFKSTDQTIHMFKDIDFRNMKK